MSTPSRPDERSTVDELVDRVGDKVGDAVDKAEGVGEGVARTSARAGDRFESIGRVGWVAKGIVYGLIGALFVRVALSGGSTGSDQANQAGAIEDVADSTFGTVLLIVLAAGLALYAAWRAFTVVMPGDWTGRALLDRGGYLVSTIVYLALLATSIGLLASEKAKSPDGREDRMVEDLVKDLFSVPAGRAIVIAAGLAVVAIGVVFVSKGVRRSFRRELADPDGMEGSAIDHLGLVGWIARGVSMGLIGVFLIRAAWLYDADEAAGLDDSVRQLTESAWGVALALAVGLGFLAYGVFAALSARHRILKGPTNDG